MARGVPSYTLLQLNDGDQDHRITTRVSVLPETP
jgi:hypothetical protein